MNDALNSASTDDDVAKHEADKCARCEHGQKVSYGNRLCDYGVQAVPTASMRHPMGLCGPSGTLFTQIKRYAEFDE